MLISERFSGVFNLLRSSLVSSAAVVVLCFAGCSESGDSVVSGNPDSTTAAAPSPFANSCCPIMGNEIAVADVTDDLTRDWNGKKVAFCCPPCLEEWDEMSDEDKAKAVANPPKKAAH
jgi:hypothetical protein